MAWVKDQKTNNISDLIKTGNKIGGANQDGLLGGWYVERTDLLVMPALPEESKESESNRFQALPGKSKTAYVFIPNANGKYDLHYVDKEKNSSEKLSLDFALDPFILKERLVTTEEKQENQQLLIEDLSSDQIKELSNLIDHKKRKIMIKQEPDHAKNIHEMWASVILREWIYKDTPYENNFAKVDFHARPGAKRPYKPEDIYVGSEGIPGFTNLFEYSYQEYNENDMYAPLREKYGPKPIPKDRPKFAGTINKHPLNEIWSTGKLKGLDIAIRAADYIENPDLHSANAGVVPLKNKNDEAYYTGEIATVDLAASLVNLTDDLDMNSFIKHIPGFGPSNHRREFSESLKVSYEGAAEDRRFASLDKAEGVKVFKKMVDCAADLYGANSREFRDAVTSMGAVQIQDDLKKTAVNFLTAKFGKRQASARERALEIELSLAFQESRNLLEREEKLLALVNADYVQKPEVKRPFDDEEENPEQSSARKEWEKYDAKVKEEQEYVRNYFMERLNGFKKIHFRAKEGYFRSAWQESVVYDFVENHYYTAPSQKIFKKNFHAEEKEVRPVRKHSQSVSQSVRERIQFVERPKPIHWRNALPFVGAAVGFLMGGPIGAAIGGAIGIFAVGIKALYSKVKHWMGTKPVIIPQVPFVPVSQKKDNLRGDEREELSLHHYRLSPAELAARKAVSAFERKEAPVLQEYKMMNSYFAIRKPSTESFLSYKSDSRKSLSKNSMYSINSDVRNDLTEPFTVGNPTAVEAGYLASQMASTQDEDERFMLLRPGKYK